MRHIFTILSLTVLFLNASAQPNDTDGLIDRINNHQIGITPQYVWYPVMKSSSGDSLLKIGKSATKDMISVISDTSRGIIAHFILSQIWNKELKKAGWIVGSRVSPVNEKGEIEVYLTGLTCYMKDNFSLFAKKEDLLILKEKWKAFMNAKSSR